jgi:hypothetical protein
MSRRGGHQPAAARKLNLPLSRFPLRGQAGAGLIGDGESFTQNT